MKRFLKQNWILIALVSSFLLFTFISTCNEKQSENVVSEAEMNSALVRQADSLKSSYLIKEDSIVAKNLELEKAVTERLKPKIVYLKSDVKAKVEIARKDTNLTASCDSAITSLEALCDTLSVEVESYYKQVYLLEKRVELKDSLISVKEESLGKTAAINDELVAENEKIRNKKEPFLKRVGIVALKVLAAAEMIYILARGR